MDQNNRKGYDLLLFFPKPWQPLALIFLAKNQKGLERLRGAGSNLLFWCYRTSIIPPEGVYRVRAGQ